MSAVIFLLVLGLLAFFLIGVYNGLVTLRNGYKNAFAQIDVQLQRRHDLIPNLVETAKAYLGHERGTLEAVIAARGGALSALKAAQANPGDPAAMRQLSSAEGLLGGALGRFTATVEAYPELKASANMQQLSEELASTENRIAFARQAYNDGVLSYNNKREVFPNNFVAGLFGFAAAQSLELETPEARQAPKVSF
ncbi:LemA family protein [Stagnimonas aquatica]|uniref:LemA family protein n=1 Tax=Stagnimonas aquatica TaxID=2689987 RepID=A0A3N0VKE8_9GAMM|nr:LemA family protein [Stagnimonas aquatica]ROH93247.1 LemA family protein [Stagnimonas aquatica]